MRAINFISISGGIFELRIEFIWRERAEKTG